MRLCTYISKIEICSVRGVCRLKLTVVCDQKYTKSVRGLRLVSEGRRPSRPDG